MIYYASRQKVRVRDVIMNSTLNLVKRDFNIDLILVKLGRFDIIVGMHWLSKNRAKIYCAEKIVRIPLPQGGILEVH